MNHLKQLVEKRYKQFEAQVAEQDKLKSTISFPSFQDYALPKLREEISSVLRIAFELPELTPQLELIERDQFAADLVVKIPHFLKDGGPKNYIQNYVPKIQSTLAEAESLKEIIEEISVKGMYINLRLSSSFLFGSLSDVFKLGADFGKSNTENERRIVIDYSAPNAAKQLHAGHIRSTIIGHVLSNLHENCAAQVFRVNHINDLGGFGFLLEGYQRFAQLFTDKMSPNDKLLKLYALRRSLERAVALGEKLDELTEADRELLSELSEDLSPQALKELYDSYTARSDERFEALENGEKAEVELWDEMISWSMEDFERFYTALDIHLPYVLGESFYLFTANELFDHEIEQGRAFCFTEELAAAERSKVDELLEKKKIKEREHSDWIEGINKDIGAIVVPLSNIQRLVIRRSDGRSIYATRDVGAIKTRQDLFGATDILYVVGQEQREHFAGVFEAARVLGIAGEEKPNLTHIYFGFYVDAANKKKLSSREGASNVHLLLSESVKYFEEKYEGSDDFSAEERHAVAEQLAVGSLVFNDLKKDMKGSVDIHAGDLRETIAEFEKSGGAYVVYTACRARAILRKFGKELPALESIQNYELNEDEISLIKKIQLTPEKISTAADSNNPSVLLRHLLDTSAAYNSYYANNPVLTALEEHPHRLHITAALQQTLENALRICHIECPERI